MSGDDWRYPPSGHEHDDMVTSPKVRMPNWVYQLILVGIIVLILGRMGGCW